MIIKILTVILILLILIMLLKVKIEFSYSDKKLSVFFKMLFLKKKIRSNKKVKSTEKSRKAESEEALFTDRLIKAQEKIRHFYDIHTKLSQLTKKYFNVEKFEVNIDVGTGDAATTAISVGALWAVVYNFIGALGMLIYIDNPEVEILPNYKETRFKTNARCILSCRIVHIIFIIISFLINNKTYRRKKK